MAATMAARANGTISYPICTAIVAAGANRVTDVVNVPEDAVSAQIQHLDEAYGPLPLRVGVMGSHKVLDRLFDVAERGWRPFVLDIRLRGALGEELLSPRGVNALLARLQVPDLVLIGRRDTESLTGMPLHSLDDAQVAAQRLVQRGARAVLLRCGPLPARFYADEADGADQLPYDADLYFDGQEFALLEAPHLPNAPQGAAEAFGMTLLTGLMRGEHTLEALQRAKRFVTEAIRQRAHGSAPLNYFWDSPAPRSEG